MRHLLSVLVRNHAGVLSHVAGLFTRRSYNIESLVAGETENTDISRITIVVSGDEWVLEQVTKQLRKLIDVIKVTDLKFDKSIRRELALITVMTTSKTRREVIEIAQVFKASIVDMSEETITVEFSVVDGYNNPIDGAIVTVLVKGLKDITWYKEYFKDIINEIWNKIPDLFKGSILQNIYYRFICF